MRRRKQKGTLCAIGRVGAMVRNLLFLCLVMLAPRPCEARKGDAGGEADCRYVKLEVERLPDLNLPRGGHQVLCVDGEVMVVGGHTSGFVPTATAEFLCPGEDEWRLQPMAYEHDFGFALPLQSGQVLIGGGAAQPLGIGQTHTVERYDPATRTFDGFGCLDTKRMMPSAVELDSGRVVIAGNWYHDDGVELFDGEHSFVPVKEPEASRAYPYIIPLQGGDALILGALGARGQVLDFPSTVERLHGAPLQMPLLRQWPPIRLMTPHNDHDAFVGYGEQGAYRHLLVLEDQACTYRIALVEDTTLSFLKGLAPLPKRGPGGQTICYFSSVIADRSQGRGYVVGRDSLHAGAEEGHRLSPDACCRYYVFSFSYAPLLGSPGGGQASAAPVLYYTEPLCGLGFTTPVLLPDGDMVLAGGTMDNNFAPLGAAYRFCLGPHPLSAHSRGWALWVWLCVVVVLLGGGVVAVVWRRRRRGQPQAAVPVAPASAVAAKGEDNEQLMARICQLMEDKQLYLNSALKAADVADLLGIGRRRVSECVVDRRGCVFSQFVNGYRVDHAKQLLRQHPDMKMAAVCVASGFTNETSFFRSFKTFTGMTPREWMQKID